MLFSVFFPIWLQEMINNSNNNSRSSSLNLFNLVVILSWMEHLSLSLFLLQSSCLPCLVFIRCSFLVNLLDSTVPENADDDVFIPLFVCIRLTYLLILVVVVYSFVQCSLLSYFDRFLQLNISTSLSICNHIYLIAFH